MHDEWVDRLSEYMDGTMERADREALDAHLSGCPECALVLADLKRVRAMARERAEAPVPPEIWTRIERAIAPPGGAVPRIARLDARGRGRSFSLPELLAACLAVALVSGGVVFAVIRHAAPARPLTVARGPEPTAPSGDAGEHGAPGSDDGRPVEAMPATTGPAPTVTPSGETPTEEAITELRKALARRRDQLDPATIRTLETNLAIIDLAIDQAKRALVADSANTYVKEHLAETMRRKVQLLQRATMLASTSGSEESR